MTSRCLSSACLNGNCEGCRNGSKYCNDPRCYPNCPDCEGQTSVNCVNKRNGWDWALIIIVTALSVLLLIIIALLSWGWYDTQSEMENYTDQQQRYYYPYEYYNNEYYNNEYPQEYQTSSPVNNPRRREIDASLDVDVRAVEDTPFNDVIPDVPPVNTNQSVPSVASARAPPPPPTNVVDSTIRGF
jgi:hypothetical protein